MAISLGGGGSASQINEIITLNRDENVVTLADGRVYLKGGVVETTTSNYPDAKTSFLNTSSFSVSSEESTPYGLAYDGTYLWVAGGAGDDVTKWSTAGVYQNVSFSTASQDGLVFGIEWDGTNFWASGYLNRKIYKYNSSGVYQNFYIDVSSQTTTPYSSAWDGSHLWVIGRSEATVFKYNSSGTYQGVSFSVAAQESSPAA